MKLTKVTEEVYQVDTGYACFGIEVDTEGKIIKTAPIGRWMLDKNIKEIKWK